MNLNEREVIIYNTDENLVVRNTLFSKCKELRIEKANICIFTRCSFPILERLYVIPTLCNGPIFYYCTFNSIVQDSVLQMKCQYINYDVPNTNVSNNTIKEKNDYDNYDKYDEDDEENCREIQEILNSHSEYKYYSPKKNCIVEKFEVQDDRESRTKDDSLIIRKENGDVCLFSTLMHVWSVFAN